MIIIQIFIGWKLIQSTQNYSNFKILFVRLNFRFRYCPRFLVWVRVSLVTGKRETRSYIPSESKEEHNIFTVPLSVRLCNAGLQTIGRYAYFGVFVVDYDVCRDYFTSSYSRTIGLYFLWNQCLYTVGRKHMWFGRRNDCDCLAIWNNYSISYSIAVVYNNKWCHLWSFREWR